MVDDGDAVFPDNAVNVFIATDIQGDAGPRGPDILRQGRYMARGDDVVVTVNLT